MKRESNLWSQVVSLPNLYLAYYKARLGKQQRPAVAAFSLELESEILQLQRELVNRCYQPGAYRQFIIFERKQRLISAAPFRDRVVHHALMNILEPVLERRFYYHSYACRPNKGTHRAVNQYQDWARRYAYVMKLDIARYFPSVDKEILKSQLRSLLKEPQLMDLIDLIIDGYPGCGLPIGNLTSQYFANYYLSHVDHWIKQALRVPAYLRYVDDLILLADDKAFLWSCRDEIVARLSELGLSIHPKKQQLHMTSERVDVLGYKVSRQRRWLRNDNGYRFQRKLKRKACLCANNRLDFVDINNGVQSWIGHAQHGETQQLRRAIFDGVTFRTSRGRSGLAVSIPEIKAD